MATLLDGVNKVLRRAQIIDSDLATLTSSGKQAWIDICVQVWNEVVIDLYSKVDEPFPTEVVSDTFTLAASDRSYPLASDLITLRFPIKDETNGRYIGHYPGGFMEIVKDQYFINQEVGLPYLGAFNPEDGELYLDYLPTANEAGLVYKYWYDKDLELDDATDVFPFNNHVFLALVPAVYQLWKADVQNKFDEDQYDRAMGLASKSLIQVQQHDSYAPLRLNFNQKNDPYAH